MPEAVETSLLDLSRQVRGIANNVNQMARRSHMMAHVLDEVEVFYKLKELEDDYRQAIAHILSAGPNGEGEPNPTHR